MSSKAFNKSFMWVFTTTALARAITQLQLNYDWVHPMFRKLRGNFYWYDPLFTAMCGIMIGYFGWIISDPHERQVRKGFYFLAGTYFFLAVADWVPWTTVSTSLVGCGLISLAWSIYHFSIHFQAREGARAEPFIFIFSILIFFAWLRYISWLGPRFPYMSGVGGGWGILLAFPLTCWAILCLPKYRNSSYWLLVAHLGYIGHNHLIAYFLVNPAMWNPLLGFLLLGATSLLIAVGPISVLFFLKKQSSFHNADEQLAVSWLRSLQFSYIIGWAAGMLFVFAVLVAAGPEHLSASFVGAAFLGCVAMGGVITILYRLRSLRKPYTIFLRNDLAQAVSQRAGWKTWGIVSVALMVGTLIEQARGLWLFWGVSVFIFLVILIDFWQVFRQVAHLPVFQQQHYGDAT